MNFAVQSVICICSVRELVLEIHRYYLLSAHSTAFITETNGTMPDSAYATVATVYSPGLSL